jgi:hypothetical protein
MLLTNSVCIFALVISGVDDPRTPERELADYLQQSVGAGVCDLEIGLENQHGKIEAKVSAVFKDTRLRLCWQQKNSLFGQIEDWSKPWKVVFRPEQVINWRPENNGAVVSRPSQTNNLYAELRLFYPQFIGQWPGGTLAMPDEGPRGFLATADRKVASTISEVVDGVAMVKVSYEQASRPPLEVWFRDSSPPLICKMREHADTQSGAFDRTVTVDHKQWSGGVWYPEKVTTEIRSSSGIVREITNVLNFEAKAIDDSEFDLKSLDMPVGLDVINATGPLPTLCQWTGDGLTKVDMATRPQNGKRIAAQLSAEQGGDSRLKKDGASLVMILAVVNGLAVVLLLGWLLFKRVQGS